VTGDNLVVEIRNISTEYFPIWGNADLEYVLAIDLDSLFPLPVAILFQLSTGQFINPNP
jgi:hypothetical protein